MIWLPYIKSSKEISILDIGGKDLIVLEAIGILLSYKIQEISQIMYNLFYRKQSISDILKCSYKELKYWNECHEIMANTEIEEARKLKGLTDK